jgi:hypothetical protein
MLHAPSKPAVSRGRRLLRALRRRWIAAGATALIAVPALADLLTGVHTAPFRWIAADVFYYLTVGRNVARTGRFTFDGEHAMNGFHPLWQVCVALLELLRLRAHLGEVAPFLIVLASLFAVAGGAWLVALTFLRQRRASPVLLLMAIGVYPLLVLPLWIRGLRNIVAAGLEGWMFPVFGTPWSYMNGMESGVTILFFALSLHLATSPGARSSPRAAAWVGAALAVFTLARLDHGIIAAAMLAGFAAACLRARSRASAASAIAAFVALLAPYLLNNRICFGGFMPTSGAAKTTFPHFNPEHVDKIVQLYHGKYLGSPWWLPVICREAQIVVPPILALIYLVVRAVRWRRTTRLDWMLASAAVGAVGLALYNFAYGKYEGQGFWYYPVSTLLPTLFVATARFPRSPRFPRIRWTPARRFAALAVAAALTLAFFFGFHRHATYNREFATFFTKTSKVVRAVYPAGLPRFVEVDDGAVSYALDACAEPIVWALDPEAFTARQEHRQAELSHARGFRHLASFAYQPHDRSPGGIQAWAAGSFGQSMARYVVEREYASPDGMFVLVRFEER